MMNSEFPFHSNSFYESEFDPIPVIPVEPTYSSYSEDTLAFFVVASVTLSSCAVITVLAFSMISKAYKNYRIRQRCDRLRRQRASLERIWLKGSNHKLY